MILLPFSHVDGAWIGFNDIHREKHFVWVNPAGHNNRYTNWRRGEPNNSGGNEDCTAVIKSWNGQWNDENCNTKKAFIVETGRRTTGTYHNELFISYKNVYRNILLFYHFTIFSIFMILSSYSKGEFRDFKRF